MLCCAEHLQSVPSVLMLLFRHHSALLRLPKCPGTSLQTLSGPCSLLWAPSSCQRTPGARQIPKTKLWHPTPAPLGMAVQGRLAPSTQHGMGLKPFQVCSSHGRARMELSRPSVGLSMHNVVRVRGTRLGKGLLGSPTCPIWRSRRLSCLNRLSRQGLL